MEAKQSENVFAIFKSIHVQDNFGNCTREDRIHMGRMTKFLALIIEYFNVSFNGNIQ